MRKIGVIGLGHVGATIAYTLVTKGIADELVLIDSNEDKAVAEEYDLRDTLSRLDTFTKIIPQDYTALKDADVIITAFGNISAIKMDGDRFGELNYNAAVVAEVAQKIKKVGFNGVLINISNPCDVITTLLQRQTGLSKKQVFGTGTFLDTARMQRAVGQAVHEDPKNISGYVLGEHGESQFTAWSTVEVKGHTIEDAAAVCGLDLADLDHRARRGGWLIFSGKHYTCYAITTCAIKLALAVLSDAHLACPTSVYLENYGHYIGYPAVIGRQGVVEINKIKLTIEEQAKLDNSAKIISEKLTSLH
ncbi:L-lactate dehydrogenase [Liquorilactobacillus sucicola DSM 21376 = JCM 15457]|uniref:L-2-hydroxyisocaproate dehydrogenase n=1 Tax=Liquorilactobacillus sucicola DSM 21376 = JCM 15457 TaxID=1423806 RepID=A0A023CZG0_9LACO|nr:L-lactate dehydrogenase [Liquorilactobacillus sucicola]KRN05784.1 L-2-hydroxyisocaproate dehydrogenase [Liquorilactobacillus sucicola DSM 21376 = JCM 15457]GAJ27257.1 L-lactate dehydrogenase [Liquorilactobacillus sucicola DSM 21376 = JCM 15457]